MDAARVGRPDLKMFPSPMKLPPGPMSFLPASELVDQGTRGPLGAYRSIFASRSEKSIGLGQ